MYAKVHLSCAPSPTRTTLYISSRSTEIRLYCDGGLLAPELKTNLSHGIARMMTFGGWLARGRAVRVYVVCCRLISERERERESLMSG